jgi:hypothetical protein
VAARAQADDDRSREGGTMGVGRWVSVGMLLVLVATLGGCPPFGLARGDYWSGLSTGDLGPCPSFDIDLAIAEDRVSGTATTEYSFGTVLWDVRGLRSDKDEVTVEIRTGDPRVTRQITVWTGAYNAVFWHLTERPDPSCPKPRTVGLQRK